GFSLPRRSPASTAYDVSRQKRRTRMSSITGLSSSTLASLLAANNSSTSDTTALTPLQRAQALAQQAGANGAGGASEAALVAETEQSALTSALVSALTPTDTSDYGPAYDLSGGLFDTAYDSAIQTMLDQVGATTPASQWQQIQTPDGVTPGESQSVDP